MRKFMNLLLIEAVLFCGTPFLRAEDVAQDLDPMASPEPSASVTGENSLKAGATASLSDAGSSTSSSKSESKAGKKKETKKKKEEKKKSASTKSSKKKASDKKTVKPHSRKSQAQKKTIAPDAVPLKEN